MSRLTNSKVLEKINLTLPDDKNHFNCAISLDVMDDPVLDPHTLNPAALAWLSASSEEKAILDCGNFNDVPRYDKKNLEKLIGDDGTGKSPSTRLLFTAQELIPDIALKSQIDLFMHPLREQALRSDIEVEAQNSFSRLQHFFSRQMPGAVTSTSRIPSDAVNPILQLVVFGEEGKVKAALEAVKSNATQLSALLSNTGTAIDYSDRTITGMTLLQAAAAAGDIEMCQMLKSYMDADEFNNQLAEIFPEGIEAHEAKQQQDAFNFDAILATIAAANTTDLNAALSKQNNGSALCRALDAFRLHFTEISHSEKIFNPYHLLRAYEAYNKLWDQYERDGSDRDYKKRDLFWRQIIGYVQRFMPACYAQAFVQGLWDLVKVDGYQGSYWRPKALKRNLKFKYDPGSYFSADSSSSRSVYPGLGFDIAIYAVGYGCRSVWAYTARGGDCGLPRRFFKNFCRTKTSSFQNIMPRVRMHSRERSSDECRCVIQ